MKFTALNIKNQEFNTGLKGYNKEEVKAFLERLADEFETLQLENEKSRKELESCQEKIKSYAKIEKHLQNALVTAQESSSKSVESAKKQTALIVREAELKANQMIEKAKEDANSIRESVVKLREEKTLLISKLKAMIETQANLLDMGSVYVDSKHTNIINQKVVEKKSEINVDEILEKLL